MKFLIVLLSVWALAVAVPYPQDDADADAETPDPADPTDPADPADPADPDATTDTPTDPSITSDTSPPDTTDAADDNTTEKPKESEEMQKKDKVETTVGEGEGVTIICPTQPPYFAATLTLDPLEDPPPNVVTDNYGGPVKEIETKTYQLEKPRKLVIVEVEKWLTYHTRPPTKPNCMCLTRGPLSRFKLIGNLHFRGIKRPPKRLYTTPSVDSTICPPCNCADCFTTETATEKKKKQIC